MFFKSRACIIAICVALLPQPTQAQVKPKMAGWLTAGAVALVGGVGVYNIGKWRNKARKEYREAKQAIKNAHDVVSRIAARKKHVAAARTYRNASIALAAAIAVVGGSVPISGVLASEYQLKRWEDAVHTMRSVSDLETALDVGMSPSSVCGRFSSLIDRKTRCDAEDVSFLKRLEATGEWRSNVNSVAIRVAKKLDANSASQLIYTLPVEQQRQCISFMSLDCFKSCLERNQCFANSGWYFSDAVCNRGADFVNAYLQADFTIPISQICKFARVEGVAQGALRTSVERYCITDAFGLYYALTAGSFSLKDVSQNIAEILFSERPELLWYNPLFNNKEGTLLWKLIAAQAEDALQGVVTVLCKRKAEENKEFIAIFPSSHNDILRSKILVLSPKLYAQFYTIPGVSISSNEIEVFARGGNWELVQEILHVLTTNPDALRGKLSSHFLDLITMTNLDSAIKNNLLRTMFAFGDEASYSRRLMFEHIARDNQWHAGVLEPWWKILSEEERRDIIIDVLRSPSTTDENALLFLIPRIDKDILVQEHTEGYRTWTLLGAIKKRYTDCNHRVRYELAKKLGKCAASTTYVDWVKTRPYEPEEVTEKCRREGYKALSQCLNAIKRGSSCVTDRLESGLVSEVLSQGVRLTALTPEAFDVLKRVLELGERAPHLNRNNFDELTCVHDLSAMKYLFAYMNGLHDQERATLRKSLCTSDQVGGPSLSSLAAEKRNRDLVAYLIEQFTREELALDDQLSVCVRQGFPADDELLYALHKKLGFIDDSVTIEQWLNYTPITKPELTYNSVLRHLGCDRFFNDVLDKKMFLVGGESRLDVSYNIFNALGSNFNRLITKLNQETKIRLLQFFGDLGTKNAEYKTLALSVAFALPDETRQRVLSGNYYGLYLVEALFRDPSFYDNLPCSSVHDQAKALEGLARVQDVVDRRSYDLVQAIIEHRSWYRACVSDARFLPNLLGIKQKFTKGGIEVPAQIEYDDVIHCAPDNEEKRTQLFVLAMLNEHIPSAAALRNKGIDTKLISEDDKRRLHSVHYTPTLKERALYPAYDDKGFGASSVEDLKGKLKSDGYDVIVVALEKNHFFSCLACYGKTQIMYCCPTPKCSFKYCTGVECSRLRGSVLRCSCTKLYKEYQGPCNVFRDTRDELLVLHSWAQQVHTLTDTSITSTFPDYAGYSDGLKALCRIVCASKTIPYDGTAVDDFVAQAQEYAQARNVNDLAALIVGVAHILGETGKVNALPTINDGVFYTE